MCIMHPKYKSTPATNSCNRGGFIRKGVLTLPAPFFTQLQINLWYKNFMYVCSSREMVPSLRQKTHPVCRDRAIHPQCRFFHPVSFPQIRMNTERNRNTVQFHTEIEASGNSKILPTFVRQ